jgi:hypothetical protein
MAFDTIVLSANFRKSNRDDCKIFFDANGASLSVTKSLH